MLSKFKILCILEPTKIATMEKKQRRIAYLIILLACFFIYGSTLKNGYALDDEYVIVNNKQVEKGIKGIPKIFTSPYIQLENETHGYRPITMTTFAIEYELFGVDSQKSHLINVLLYALTCMLLFRLLLRLFKEYHWSLAAMAVFFFLILPVHSEVVNNVKSRDELLSFLFAIVSLSYFLKYATKKTWSAVILGIVFFALSIGSKLSSLPFLALIPFTLWFFTDIKMKRFIWIVGAMAFLLVMFRFAGGSVVEGVKVRELLYHENPLFDEGGLFTARLPMAFFTVLYYLKLLIYPKVLICYYGYNQVPILGWDSPFVWVSMLGVLGLVGVALWKIKTKAIWVYGVLFFLASISMFSNFPKPAVGIVAERFVYIASLGFCIAIAHGLYVGLKFTVVKEKLTMNLKPFFFIGMAGIFFMSSARIISRNSEWKDKVTLLSADAAVATNSAKMHALIANQLFVKVFQEQQPGKRSKYTEDAIFHYERCVEIYPGYAASWNNLGTLYFNEVHDYNRAQECFEKAIEVSSDYIDPLFALAYCYELKEDYDSAEKYYNKVLEIDPEYTRATGRLKEITTLREQKEKGI